MILKALILKYLLMPLIALVLVGIMALLKKKNAAMQNKKLVVYILIAALLIGLPGFCGIAGVSFSPWWYLFVQLFYLGLGVIHVTQVQKTFENVKTYQLLFQYTLTLLCACSGIYIFILLFEWISENKGYAWMAATTVLVFPLPLLFYDAYIRLTNIPFEIYKVWEYTDQVTNYDFDNIKSNFKILTVEFFSTANSGQRMSAKAKAPDDIAFGDWFRKIVHDYNLKNPENKLITVNEENQTYSWVFYYKKSFFYRRRYIDPDITIGQLKLTEAAIIMCKRVIQYEEEKVILLKNNN